MNYYDQDGRLVATTTPGTVTYSLATPSACNPLTTATCDGVTYYSYDEVGHRTQTITPAGPSGVRGVTTNYFDANGNLVASVTPIGAGTGCNPLTSSTCLGASYSTYDADNRLLTVSYTDGTPTVSYTYNADGSKATQTDGTGTSTFSYDSAGRLIGTTNGAGATTTWGYNTLGQLICQSYDNVAGNTCRGSGAGTSSPPAGLLTFTYDANGRASSLITWSGVTLTTAYDCAGSKAWVSTGTASVLSCDASHLGTPAIPTSSSAITTTYPSNSLGQFTNQATTTNGGVTNLLSFSFSYDDLSRLISSTPTVNTLTKTTDSYAYDPTSRVTSGPITGTTGNPNYSYSQSGAITQATTHFASAAYSQNGQLCWTNPTAVTSPSCASTPTTATSFTYDLNGNRTASSSAAGFTSLTWQSTSGRLVCVNTAGTTCSSTSPTSTTTLYSYDGDGHRMTSSNNGTTNAFIWDTSASQLLADSTHDYVYLQGSVTPDLQINLTTGTVDLLIQDQNANTRGVVQVTGANSSLNNTLVNYTDYDAYGNAITQSGGTINPGGMANNGVTTDISTSFAFGAGYWDSSNLTYLVHRYLDNETGQFISVDPLVDQTREAYVYAGDGPLMSIDSSGLYTVGFCAIGSVSAVGFTGSGQLCLTRTTGTKRDEIGLVLDVGVTIGVINPVPEDLVAGGGGVVVTNANSLSSLKGLFYCSVLGVGPISITVFSNNKPGKPGWIYGIEIAAQSGISLGVGIGGSFSWIHQFTSFWDQGPAKLLWDSFGGASAVPLGGTVAALNIAKTKYLPDLIKRIPVGGQSK
jgi:RHS repeat-associated protein